MKEEELIAASVASNEEELRNLAWAVNMSQGQFSLILARSNHIFMRQELVERLEQICPVEIQKILLEPSITKMYAKICDRLKEQIADAKPAAFMVLGLETVKDIKQLVTSMNVAREEFRKNCPFPLILWINSDISQQFIRLAPDIYSWATLNIFEINPTTLQQHLRKQTDSLFKIFLAIDNHQILNHSHVVDTAEITIIKTAYQEIQQQGIELTADLQASLQFALGREAYINEEIDHALAYYQNSLNFWQNTTNSLRQSIVIFNIGLCYYRQAYLARIKQDKDWQMAKNYFWQCIQIFEAEQRQDLVAKFISFCGEVLRQIQDWQQLEQLAHKSLRLHQIYGTQIQIAQDYGFLAEVALCQKNPVLAKEMSSKALEISAQTSQKNHQKGLYLLLLALSWKHLGEIEVAVKTLEIAKQEDPQENPRLYIKILEELQKLYFESKQYLTAFEIKQTQRSLEQQFGFRAFIGAGRLQPQIHIGAKQNYTHHQDIIAEEIIASGRQRDINRLIERIGSTQYKLTVIYGQSGVGKSSLVNAGLVPALKVQNMGTRDVVPIALRVYTDWVRELGQLLKKNIKHDSHLNLDSVVSIVEQLIKNSQANLLTVLIFDQFEEFFFVFQEPSQRAEFFDFLGDCLNLTDVKIVISMREDYLHHLLVANKLPKMAAINQDILSKHILYQLGNFAPEDAKKFITGLSQLNLEPALIDAVVADLSSNLDEVRPIELQVVGAQIQTDNITTLVQYQQLGPKEKLVQRYLDEIIQDCGAENEQVVRIVLYLLTDENNTRPLKTLAELEKDLQVLSANLKKESEKLSLILKILVKSGFIFLLPEYPANRYQLVHDYLVTFIRRQQEAQLNQLIIELEQERKQRQVSEEQLRTLEAANKLLAQAQQKSKKETIKPNKWHQIQMLCISLGVTGFVVFLRFLGLLQHWEWLAFDQYIRWRRTEPVDQRIVIVGINDEDLHNLQQAMITDATLAKLINNLKARKPRAIGLNIYRDLPVEPGHQALVKVFKSTPNLIGIEKVVGDKKYERVDAPIELKELGQVGANDVIVDADGKVRRGLIYLNTLEGETIYSFSLYLALLYLKPEGISLTQDFQLGKTQLQPFQSNDGGYARADDHGYQILMNYRGGRNSFEIISLTDILENNVPPNWGQDKVILIGYAAESFGDYFLSPYSSDIMGLAENIRGVEIQANLTSQLISAALEQRPLINTFPEYVEIIFILIGSVIGVLLIWQFSSWKTSGLSIMIISSILLIISYIIILCVWWFPIIPVILALFSSATIIMIFNKGQIEKLQLSRTLELILENYHNNPEVGSRAIEYFFISNQGIKLTQENILNITLNTLKYCQNVHDIADVVDKVTWIPLTKIKENDLLWINKLINVSCDLQTFNKTDSIHLQSDVIYSSIIILKQLLEDIDNHPQTGQTATFKDIINKWLLIFQDSKS
ncbi:MAG: CHASE2 domain-containing protein [Sphaerospermopsis sp. SIO1G1]|nr:CHASE2 domain-containing protein [Sphaerospermopsis sp. SIO1G1]